jgi:hypothetical protein
MPFDARGLRVLIASPGDVADARDTIERELHEWNSAHSLALNVTLHPLRWEIDGVPLLARGDAQNVLNEQIVDSADIVIGIFHTRLGSPTARAASGTAEELERTSADGKPVHVWFSEQPLPYDVDAEQFQALRTFRAALESTNFVGTFTSGDELRTKLRRALDYDVSRLTVDDDVVDTPGPRPADDGAGLTGLEELLELPPIGGRLPRVKEIDPYSLGVTLSSYAGRRDGSDRYVERDCDERLQTSVRQNTFTVVVGPSKAGKSRTAYEAAVRVLGDARLVVPRFQMRSLPNLARDELIVGEKDVVVIWLDDLDRFLVPTEGFDLAVLRRLTSRKGRTVLLATLRRERRRQLAQAGELERGIRLLLNGANLVSLESRLTSAERQAATHCYPGMNFSIAGIGELLASVPELRRIYEDALPIELALVQAAIDWARAGIQRPIPEAELRDLAAEYLLVSRPQHPSPPPADLSAALDWATTNIGGQHGHVSLLRAERLSDGSLAYRAFDYLIALDDGQDGGNRPIPEIAVDFIRNRVSPEEALLLGRQAEVRSVETDGDGLDAQADSEVATVDGSEAADARPQATNTRAPVDDRAYIGGGTASIFISYSSHDAAVADQLIYQLRAEGLAAPFLDFDPDEGIPTGRNWERELYAGLRQADAVVFLASSTSVTSRWNFAEIGLARSLGRPVIPVRLEPDVSLALLDDVQWIDATRMGEEGVQRTVAGLLQALRGFGIDPSDTYAWDSTRSPYPGLAAFTADDAAMFFGRDPEIDRLMDLLQPTLARGDGRFVALVGPSGSGKSSLLRAGLLPRLLRRSDTWVVVPPLLPGRHPMGSLARSLAVAFASQGRPREFDELVDVLEKEPDGLSRLASELAELGPEGAKVLVVVDQAEELVTRAGRREQETFLRALTEALHGRSPMWAVATVRSEFLSSTPNRAGLAEAIDDTLVIEPLSRTRLPEVIVRPAQRAGLTFVPGLVELMVDDTPGGDALPLLAYTLRELALSAGPAGTISMDDYARVGGVIGALQRRADQLAHALAEGGLGHLVMPTLLRLVTVTGDDEPTGRRLSRSALGEDELAVVDAFVDARLLTAEETTVEVAHEALLRRWPPLSDAIQRSRDQLRQRSQLDLLVADWLQGNRDESYLLRGSRLAAFDGWAPDHGAEIGGTAQEFLSASRAIAVNELAWTRRSNRRLRLLVLAIFVLLLVAVASMATAFWLYQELRRLRGF